MTTKQLSSSVSVLSDRLALIRECVHWSQAPRVAPWHRNWTSQKYPRTIFHFTLYRLLGEKLSSYVSLKQWELFIFCTDSDGLHFRNKAGVCVSLLVRKVDYNAEAQTVVSTSSNQRTISVQLLQRMITALSTILKHGFDSINPNCSPLNVSTRSNYHPKSQSEAEKTY